MEKGAPGRDVELEPEPRPEIGAALVVEPGSVKLPVMKELAILLCGGLFVPPAPSAISHIQEEPKPERVQTIPEHGLAFTVPELEGISRREGGGEIAAFWTGTLHSSKVSIVLRILPADKFSLVEPEDVLELIEFNALKSRTDEERKEFAWLPPFPGGYGYVAYCSRARLDARSSASDELVANTWYLFGMLENAGYVIEARCDPGLDSGGAAPITEFFEKGIQYDGKQRNCAWDDEEASARFKRDAPEDTHKEFEKGRKKKNGSIVRTDHYIIFTNSSAGKLFAEKMEECYSTVQAIFPFAEISGRRLMPVFLFQTREQYVQYYMKVANKSREGAEASKGHAWKDYYATWYEAPNDPVHVHEATHQIFDNRLFLPGGGSWFQEGVAEYVETERTRNDRNAMANRIAKGQHKPLREFMQLDSLLDADASDTGGLTGGELYSEAAVLIEFLRDGTLVKDKKERSAKFERFLNEVGRLPRGDIRAIEKVLKDVYGLTIEDLDQRFQAYCKKR